MRFVPFAVAAVLLLGGCAATSGPAEPMGSAAPAPAPASAAPSAPTPAIDVTVRAAELPAPREQIPPTRVRIDRGAVDIPVVPVGVAPDGGMELPPNVSVGGWYRFGADPATGAGTTVIAAHVDSLEYGLGPFVALRDLVPGDPVVVTAADGVEHRYNVQEVRKMLKEQLPTDELFDRSGPERLALITCGGTFDRDSRTYSDNVVVIAVRAE